MNRLLLILCIIPATTLAMNVFIDYCQPGQEPWRIQITADPKIESYRLHNFLFGSYNINPSQYKLLYKGERLDPDCRIGHYRKGKNGDVFLSVTTVDSEEPCVYRSACDDAQSQR